MYSLDCAAHVEAWIEWGVIVVLLLVTAILVAAGAVHYTVKRRALMRQLEYAPIAANSDG